MTWVKHSDDFSSHPKVVGLSDKAYRLHFCALEYCSRHLTDGVISEMTLRTVALTAGVLRPNAVANSLLKVGLWDRYRKTNWRIHDYLEYNPSAADVKAERKKAAERMKELRAKRSGEVLTNVRANERRTKPARSGSPTRPGSLSKDKGTNNGHHAFDCPDCGVDCKSKTRLEEHIELVHA